MRPFARIAIFLHLFMFPAGSAFAQVPPLPFTASEKAPPSEPDAAPPLFPSPFAPSSSPRWSLDALLGLPTGLRTQVRLGESAWSAEGIAGLFIFAPMLGGGFRHCFTLLSGERNALCLSPGIDAYYIQNPYNPGSLFGGWRQAGFITADVDVLWRHAYGRWLQGDLGIKLGAGGLFGGGIRGVALPVVSLIGGLRF